MRSLLKFSTIVTAFLFAQFSSADVLNVDVKESVIKWKAGKKIGSFHEGEVKVKSGSLETDAKGAVKAISVVVDMKSISDNDLKDKPDMQKKLVGHLSSKDFFKVDEIGESTFKSSSVTLKKDSKDEYDVKGDFTMIGKTQPIEFVAKINVAKEKATGTAKLTIERLKWGLEFGSGNIFKTLTADKIINDTFELDLNLTAKK